MSKLININHIIKEYTGANPEKPLITIDGESASYGDFIHAVEKVSRALHCSGIGAGEKVAMILPNSVWWYKIFWGIVKTGAHPVPLDPQIGEWEIIKLLSLLKVETCFIASAYRANNIAANIKKAKDKLPLLKRVISLDHEEDGILSHSSFLAKGDFSVEVPSDSEGKGSLMLACTSGSTGNPKVIVVPYQGFYKAQKDMASYLNFGPDDVMLLGMPLYHQGGFGMGLQMVVSGGSVIYQTIFDPVTFLKTIEEERVSVIQLTPTLAKIILSTPDFSRFDLSSLRMCYFAGEVLPGEIARRFYEDLNIRVINIIGSSETATMVLWDSDHDRDTDVSDFRELPFTAMKILNENLDEAEPGGQGTIFIHTDALITEYYKNEAETALRIHQLEGKTWFNTGDLGIKLPGGRVRFAGRSKRIIKRGANLVYPEEIESFLLTHPEIEAVAVTGETHELIGQIIIAYIQPQKGKSITRGTIVKFSKGKLAAYKIPDQVISTDAIPHDIGKIQYKYLRKENQSNE